MKPLVILLVLLATADIVFQHGAGIIGIGKVMGDLGAAVSRGVWAER